MPLPRARSSTTPPSPTSRLAACGTASAPGRRLPHDLGRDRVRSATPWSTARCSRPTTSFAGEAGGGVFERRTGVDARRRRVALAWPALVRANAASRTTPCSACWPRPWPRKTCRRPWSANADGSDIERSSYERQAGAGAGRHRRRARGRRGRRVDLLQSPIPTSPSASGSTRTPSLAAFDGRRGTGGERTRRGARRGIRPGPHDALPPLVTPSATRELRADALRRCRRAPRPAPRARSTPTATRCWCSRRTTRSRRTGLTVVGLRRPGARAGLPRVRPRPSGPAS